MFLCADGISTLLLEVKILRSQMPTLSSPVSGRLSRSSEEDAHALIDDIVWRRINEVIPGLWIGHLNSARSFRILRDKRITTVLSVCTDFVPAQDPAMHMRHYRVPIEDVADANVLIELPAACEFIRVALREGRNVLVHSVRGQNRASAVVAAYLMQSYDLDATSALARVRNAHEPTWVSPELQEQLVLFALCGYAPRAGMTQYDVWRARCAMHAAQSKLDK